MLPMQLGGECYLWLLPMIINFTIYLHTLVFGNSHCPTTLAASTVAPSNVNSCCISSSHLPVTLVAFITSNKYCQATATMLHSWHSSTSYSRSTCQPALPVSYTKLITTLAATPEQLPIRHAGNTDQPAVYTNSWCRALISQLHCKI